ncbi:MAG TPA: hypothetical protein VHC22_02070 [Pirellulales bacterium]|nr:hypothetical protein [Pirellulales bacterium]
MANVAKELAESDAEVKGNQTAPKNQIRTAKLRRLGMEFGGPSLLRQMIGQLVNAARNAG